MAIRQVSLDELNHKDSDYLAGFADGEGCFNIMGSHSNTAFTIRFRISLRADDVAILKDFQSELGGNVTYFSAENTDSKPSYEWVVTRRDEILQLIYYFDLHPLRAKKAAEYDVWREAAFLYYRHSTGVRGGGTMRGRADKNPAWLTEAMQAYQTELSRLKEYQAQARELAVTQPECQGKLLGGNIDD